MNDKNLSKIFKEVKKKLDSGKIPNDISFCFMNKGKLYRVLRDLIKENE